MNRIGINRAIYKIILAKIEDLLNKGIAECSKEYDCKILSFTNGITMTIKNVWIDQSREFEDVYEITYSIEI